MKHPAPLLLALLAALAPAVSAGSNEPLPAHVKKALETIKGAEIVDHARILCAPKYQGREAGGRPGRLAAVHIAGDFRAMGLRPGGAGGSFYQPFKIMPGYSVEGELTAKTGADSLGEMKLGVDYMPVHLPGGKADVEAECALAGYGIVSPKTKFNEYGKLDVRGRAVVVFAGGPWSAKTGARVRQRTVLSPLTTLANKVRAAAQRGAVMVMVVENPASPARAIKPASSLGLPEGGPPLDAKIPVIHVSLDFVCALTALSRDELSLLAADIAKEQAPQSMLLRGRTVRLRASLKGVPDIGRNIVGAFLGRDKRLRNEAVVIGAHYDHLGGDHRMIMFGANDNAAGVGALLAVAKAAAALPAPPRRTLIFVAFDAEEIGRMGSRHYTLNPFIPCDRTLLMINFDMIGKNEPDSINAVATLSSPELHMIHQDMNRHVGLKLIHPQSFRLGRSDHTAFYYSRIPVMYLFGGIDDDYNLPTDTWDKLIPEKVEKVARLAFLTAWAVAERPEPISFDMDATPYHFTPLATPGREP